MGLEQVTAPPATLVDFETHRLRMFVEALGSAIRRRGAQLDGMINASPCRRRH
jgi:hypothetical protein